MGLAACINYIFLQPLHKIETLKFHIQILCYRIWPQQTKAPQLNSLLLQTRPNLLSSPRAVSQILSPVCNLRLRKTSRYLLTWSSFPGKISSYSSQNSIVTVHHRSLLLRDLPYPSNVFFLRRKVLLKTKTQWFENWIYAFGKQLVVLSTRYSSEISRLLFAEEYVQYYVKAFFPDWLIL
jgi:hypothetical protein